MGRVGGEGGGVGITKGLGFSTLTNKKVIKKTEIVKKKKRMVTNYRYIAISHWNCKSHRLGVIVMAVVTMMSESDTQHKCSCFWLHQTNCFTRLRSCPISFVFEISTTFCDKPTGSHLFEMRAQNKRACNRVVWHPSFCLLFCKDWTRSNNWSAKFPWYSSVVGVLFILFSGHDCFAGSRARWGVDHSSQLSLIREI